MTSTETFRISAALKDLIGKDLITDELVAIFELVKNAFDAYATEVQITFHENKNPAQTKIVICDNGTGMDYSDLTDKWLFVAYSSKKSTTEQKGYREKIKSKRTYAGAKGIGRFSCDRLGERLILISKKQPQSSTADKLVVNWQDFENVDDKNFIDVPVQYESLPSTPLIKITGTHLEITHLRDIWDRNRILTLKRSLVKLINPNQENDSNNFKIKIVAENEIKEDESPAKKGGDRSTWDIVNGEIENDIFETLKIKTSNIYVGISADGEQIETILEDRGDTIFRLKEKNPYPLLSDIKIYLFQLNKSAKNNFTRIMGLTPVTYGTVFMYKNGFRIYPFGEEGEDILLIDRRKAQGYNRFLGNRDLIGRIEINGAQPELRETTSRDGGLVKTESYNQLVDFFMENALKRLENYVVNVIEWGDELLDRETKKKIRGELYPKDVKIKILELITGFIDSKNILDIIYDRNFLNILEDKQNKSVDKIIKRIKKTADASDNLELKKEARLIQKAVIGVKKDAEKSEHARKQAEEKLGYVIGQNLFLKEEIGDDKQNLEAILHHIDLATDGLTMDIDALVREIRGTTDPEKMILIVQRISKENQKIRSFARYFKKVNFDVYSKNLSNDIVAFINEYVENIYRRRTDLIKNGKMVKIDIHTPKGLESKIQFSPIDIVIILDNLFSNAEKSGAKEVFISWFKSSKGKITLSFKDNGDGIKKNIAENIFDFGFTTRRRGSGLGLFHVNKLLKDMGGSIEIRNPDEKNAEFLVTFEE